MKFNITLKRLTEIPWEDIALHMSEPSLAKHMPLLDPEMVWDEERVKQFVTEKETYWEKDGLGHWAFLNHGSYVGWGGFQKEGAEWDFGLVLKQDCFGLGMHLTKKALEIAKSDKRISIVTFLLPPSRENLGALKRLEATFVGEVTYEGILFRKYVLELE